MAYSSETSRNRAIGMLYVTSRDSATGMLSSGSPRDRATGML